MSSSQNSLVPTHSTSAPNGRLTDLLSSTRRTGNDRELRDYFSAIVKRKWLILAIAFVSTAVVALYAFRLPSLYESSATLRLDSKESVFLQDSRGTVLHSYDNDDYENTQIKLLSNPQLVRRVVLQLDLDHNQSFLHTAEPRSLSSELRSMFTRRKPATDNLSAPPAVLANPEDVKALTQARITQIEPYVSQVLAGLTVQPVDRTSLVSVSMIHADPQLATQIVDALTKTFVSDNNDYESNGSREAAETLGRQIAELQMKIKAEEDARLDYLKIHHLPLEKGEGRNLTADRLGKLSAELLDAENERTNLQTTLDAARAATDPSAVANTTETQQIQELRKAINQLQQKRAALAEVYTSEWPEVKQVDAQIRQLQEQLSHSAHETISSLRSKLDAAFAREARLRQSYFDEQGAANTQTQAEVQLATLNQEIETNRQVYNTLIQHQTEMQISSVDKANHVAIVTPPVVPTAAIGPPRWNKIITAFLVSLLAGAGLAVLMKQFDRTLSSVEDVANHTGLPALALIPAASCNARYSLPQRVRLRLRGQQKESALSLTSDLRSPAAEAYRHLRAALLYSAQVSPKKILVTSGSPFEGKTTTAINTAVTLAQSGAQVLLIDCDLRRPQVHHHFDLPNSEGLTNYLSGQRVQSLIRPAEACPNLSLITAGPAVGNPADLLGSEEMRSLLSSVGESYDHVVIDSSPASSFADASIISTEVDGVVLVVHSERNSRGVLRRVKDRLEAVGANIYGVVLNDVDLSTDDYYSGYYVRYE